MRNSKLVAFNAMQLCAVCPGKPWLGYARRLNERLAG